MNRFLFAVTLLFLGGVSAAQTAPSPSIQSPKKGWQRIFDGKSLRGWSAPDMSYFSVEDDAITGTTNNEHNPPYNQFIVWQGGTVRDFELKFKF